VSIRNGLATGMMHIQIVVGSIREGRRAQPVADWTYRHVATRTDCSVELVDLKDWNLPFMSFEKPPIMGGYQDEVQRRWAQKVAQGDGYLFVSPEYNHGYTPVLKNALDYLYAEWVRKPASFVTYGGVSGARGIEQLRLVLVELQMAPLRDALHLSGIPGKLKDGVFTGDSRDEEQLDRVLDELLWWSRALGAARRDG
jgi:NAD(P)H-dependent FMN reductase